jgi:hypothetical protein
MILTPPQNISKRDFDRPTVFLAGSIEMGKAEDWQTELSRFFFESGYTVFNPRRADWDSSWKQEYENPQFFQQVTWELNALEQANVIVMYFVPETQSPISLLELGLFAHSGKLHVVCPQGFWRKGNIEIVCDRYEIPLYDDLQSLRTNFSLLTHK